MPGWLQDFLTGTDMALASGIWNTAMKAVSGLLVMSPQSFSSGTWAFVNGTLYPFALSIGLSLLNLFFIIGWLQTLTRLHENITLERTVDALIKVVFANVLFLNIKTIIRELFHVASLMTGSVFPVQSVRDLVCHRSDRLQFFDPADSIRTVYPPLSAGGLGALCPFHDRWRRRGKADLYQLGEDFSAEHL